MISRAVAFSLTSLSLGLIACVGDTPGTQPGVDASTPDSSPPSDSGAGDASVDSSDAAPSCPTTAVYEWHHPGPDGSSNAVVTTDDAGNTLAISNYGGAVDFGNGPLLSTGNNWEAAVVKFDPSGKLVWSTSFSGAGSDRANAIATDSAGDVYVVGTSSSTSMDINAKGQNTLAFSSNGGSGFVVKLKGKDGSYVWADAPSSTKFTSCNAVAVTGSHLAVGCSFSGAIATVKTVKVSNADLNATSDDQLAISYDLNGTLGWIRRIGGLGNDSVGGIAVDATGSVVVSGSFVSTSPKFVGPNNTPALDIVRVGNPAVSGLSLTWIDPSGTLARGQTFGNANNVATGNDSSGAGVVLGPLGNAVVTGRFRGSVDFKNGTLNAFPPPGGTYVCGLSGKPTTTCYDAVLLTVDKSTGATLLAKQIGGANDEFGIDVHLDGCRMVATGLNLSAALKIEGKVIDSPQVDIQNGGPWAMYAASYDPAGSVQWAKGLVSADPNGAVSPGGIGFTPTHGIRIGLGIQGDVKLDGTNVYSAGQSGQRFVVWALKP